MTLEEAIEGFLRDINYDWLVVSEIQIKKVETMIKVLICTDKPEEWIYKVTAQLNNYQIRRESKNVILIYNGLLCFEIRTDYLESRCGSIFHYAIIDKGCDNSCINTLVAPCVRGHIQFIK